MKKAVVIVAVILFFLLLLGLLLFKLLSPEKDLAPRKVTFPQPTSRIIDPDVTGTPEQVVKNCYSWYIQRYALYIEALGIKKNDPNLSRCFTAHFISEWEIGENANADPVLSAQYFYESWKDQIYTRLAGISVSDADVQVQLGTGSEQYELIAHVRRDQQGLWRIDSVNAPD